MFGNSVFQWRNSRFELGVNLAEGGPLASTQKKLGNAIESRCGCLY